MMMVGGWMGWAGCGWADWWMLVSIAEAEKKPKASPIDGRNFIICFFDTKTSVPFRESNRFFGIILCSLVHVDFGEYNTIFLVCVCVYSIGRVLWMENPYVLHTKQNKWNVYVNVSTLICCFPAIFFFFYRGAHCLIRAEKWMKQWMPQKIVSWMWFSDFISYWIFKACTVRSLFRVLANLVINKILRWFLN